MLQRMIQRTWEGTQCTHSPERISHANNIRALLTYAYDRCIYTGDFVHQSQRGSIHKQFGNLMTKVLPILFSRQTRQRKPFLQFKMNYLNNQSTVEIVCFSNRFHSKFTDQRFTGVKHGKELISNLN